MGKMVNLDGTLISKEEMITTVQVGLNILNKPQKEIEEVKNKPLPLLIALYKQSRTFLSNDDVKRTRSK